VAYYGDLKGKRMWMVEGSAKQQAMRPSAALAQGFNVTGKTCSKG